MTKKHQSVGLNFYLKENISPVHIDISDLEKHFHSRASLYRLLGLPSMLFNGKRILEVAAGSGHNSLYISHLFPKIYDICEPNPVAIEDLKKLYTEHKEKVELPNIYSIDLEKFNPQKNYDIVICEGWLGGRTEYERQMIKKLSSFVDINGILSISFYPPIGGLSSFLRRLIAFRLIKNEMGLEEQTDILKRAFSSHLKTLPHLSRSHEHWIQDSLLNPHIYVGPLEPEIALNILGPNFTVYQTVPKILSDWRWYKSLYGEQRQFNNQFAMQYHSWSHNFIDYRYQNNARAPQKNLLIKDYAENLIKACEKYEKEGIKAYNKLISPILNNMINNLRNDIHLNTFRSLREVDEILSSNFSPEDVAKMQYFSALFGREQCYISLIHESD